MPSTLCHLPARLSRAANRAPYLWLLSRAAGKAMLGLLLLGLATGSLRAQEPDTAMPTNIVDLLTLAQTNASMQVEDLLSALRSLQPEEAAPAEDAGTTNGAPTNAPNEGNSAASSSEPAYHRPSGRESRSRWSSHQQTNQVGSNAFSGSLPAGTATNAAPVSLDYSAFRLVVERNIFDPNRRPNRPPSRPESRPSRDPVYFTLVGTMSYAEGTFAFFSGSSSVYQKALKCADTIGGYKVTSISSDSVKLARDTNEVALHIGMQMRQDEDGNWAASSTPTTYTVTDFQPASSSASSSGAGAAASSGTESEILKRLMEKREKE